MDPSYHNVNVDVKVRLRPVGPRQRLGRPPGTVPDGTPPDTWPLSTKSNAPVRPHTSAPSPMTSVSTPPIAMATATPNTDATAPMARPPIGTDAEKTVV